jgi:hypothetical protein
VRPRWQPSITRQAEQTVQIGTKRKPPLLNQARADAARAKTLVKFNYWDGGGKGPLSGDAPYLDVKRMELAHHEHNQRA